MSHTPGPWTVVRIGNVPVAVDGPMDNEGMAVQITDNPHSEADARLIAAAPDLLAALETIQQHLRPRPLSPAAWIFEQVDAAVAKAKGEA